MRTGVCISVHKLVSGLLGKFHESKFPDPCKKVHQDEGRLIPSVLVRALCCHSTGWQVVSYPGPIALLCFLPVLGPSESLALALAMRRNHMRCTTQDPTGIDRKLKAVEGRPALVGHGVMERKESKNIMLKSLSLQLLQDGGIAASVCSEAWGLQLRCFRSLSSTHTVSSSWPYLTSSSNHRPR